jgi:hypothetical protein
MSFFRKLARIAAPIAGTALGGPLGGMLGGAIGRALGPKGEGGGQGGLAGMRQAVTGGAQGGFGGLQQFAQGRMGAADADAMGSRNRFAGAFGDMSSFDPSAAIQAQAQHAYRGISQQHQAGEAQRVAGLNRRGMLGSDIGGTQSQNRFNDAMSNAMAGIGMQGAQMQQSHLGNVAGMAGNMYGMDVDRSNRFADMFYGAGASDIQNRIASKEAGKDRRANFAGGIIGGVGSILGGAAGAGKLKLPWGLSG